MTETLAYADDAVVIGRSLLSTKAITDKEAFLKPDEKAGKTGLRVMKVRPK